MFTDEQFTYLTTAYIDTVFRVALNYCRSRDDAEDITQNVFLKLLRQTKPFASEAHIKHWLIRVTINECKKLFLRPWRSDASFEDYAATLTFPSPEHSDLFYAVMGLPTKYRLPIYLHYYEEYSTTQIGQILNIPKGTVCIRLKRGRELLKQSLQEATTDDR